MVRQARKLENFPIQLSLHKQPFISWGAKIYFYFFIFLILPFMLLLFLLLLLSLLVVSFHRKLIMPLTHSHLRILHLQFSPANIWLCHYIIYPGYYHIQKYKHPYLCRDMYIHRAIKKYILYHGPSDTSQVFMCKVPFVYMNEWGGDDDSICSCSCV